MQSRTLRGTGEGAVRLERTGEFGPASYRCALTRKNRFDVVVPYVPGRAGVQVTKSTLDSRMMVTGPPPSFRITTAVLGVKLYDVLV
jgi:hypothetical protein